MSAAKVSIKQHPSATADLHLEPLLGLKACFNELDMSVEDTLQ